MLRKLWSAIVKAACPMQRASFPYARGDHPGTPPPFVPAGAVWLNFLEKRASEIGRILLS